MFKFGKNWSSFAETALSDRHVERSRADFLRLMEGIPLIGRRFIDVGFGQGLIPCLAAEAGAVVTAVDVDEDNLAALARTRTHFSDLSIDVRIGSILDPGFVDTLGTFDIVHSWGVLHHTGDLVRAVANTARLSAPDGDLVLGLYNRHWTSPIWWLIKRLYNSVPRFAQRFMIAGSYPVLAGAYRLVRTGDVDTEHRGMDFMHDVVDWIGGYPYEYCTVDEAAKWLHPDFTLIRTVERLVPTGNNGLVLRRSLPEDS